MRTEWFTRGARVSQEENQSLWSAHLAYLDRTYKTTPQLHFITAEELERRSRPTGLVAQWVYLQDVGW